MSVTLVERARAHGRRVAVADAIGEHTYAELLDASARVAHALLAALGRTAASGADTTAGLGETRVAYMVAPGFDHVAALWGIWRAGGIAVPLCLTHPAPELEYVLDDTRAALVLADAANAPKLHPLVSARDAQLLSVHEPVTNGMGASAALPDVASTGDALILYTSGTTSRPKGVVLTHANLEAQVRALVEAWAWRADDCILHVLPLHHTHGIVNKLLCALWAGAACDMLPGFDAARVWSRIADDGLTLFMAVPTIYAKLIAAWDQATDAERARMSAGCRRLRLMVSGSAALPVSTFERWRQLAGHALLERYGMTEIGMALSNPLHGERRPGTVGQPLPRVGLRLVDETGSDVADGTPGEILVRGPAVFGEYWERTDATRDAFRDGWFRTGDVAVTEDGYYRILGRSSVDIIKTGGYKLSALEIEEVLRTHPTVADCAVVGVADEEWGERVCAAVVPLLAGGVAPDPDALRAWLTERLAPYKLPRRWRIVEELPRNAMGKVMKPEVRRLFESA